MCMSYTRTNIEIDPAKLKAARQVVGLKTAKATVDFALARLARTSAALESLSRLAGKVHFKKGYTYKKGRG